MRTARRPTPIRRAAARALLAGLVALASCQPAPSQRKGAKDDAGATRTPTPAFAGATPAGAAKHDVSGKYGGGLVYPLAGNPKTFNPVLANETSSTDVLQIVMFRTPIGYDRVKNEDLADLASEWSHNADFTSWSFTLREGMRWSDGHPITSDDVVFAMETILDPKVPTALRSGFTDEGPAPKVVRVDERTVRFDLTAANVHLDLYVGQIYPIPKHVLEPIYRAGKFVSDAFSVATPPDQIVVSGPYRLKEFVPDQKVVLERNPHFYGVDRDGNRLPYVDRITFLITPNFDTSLLKFKNGEVDTLEPYVYPKDYASLKDGEKSGNYTVHEVGTSYNSNFWWLNQNPGKSPDGHPYVDPQKLKWFRNVDFRRAMAHATNREGMVRTICLGLGQPLYNNVTPANKWHNPSTRRYEFDLAKAAGLLDQLGFKDKDGDGVREDPDGKPFSFRINTNSSNTDRIRSVSILVDDLGKVGIKASSEPLDFNALIDKTRHTYDYDALLLGLSTGVPPSPMTGKNVYLSSGITHYWHPNQTPPPAYEWEAQVDELMRKIDRTEAEAEQKKLFDEVQAILAEQAVWSPTYVYNYYVAAKNRVKNLKLTALRPSTYWNIEELWVE